VERGDLDCGGARYSVNIARDIERLVVSQAVMLNATGGGRGRITAIKFIGAVFLLVALGVKQRRSRSC